MHKHMEREMQKHEEVDRHTHTNENDVDWQTHMYEDEDKETHKNTDEMDGETHVHPYIDTDTHNHNHKHFQQCWWNYQDVFFIDDLSNVAGSCIRPCKIHSLKDK